MPDDKKSLSYRVWMVVDSDQFEYFIMSLIVLNTLQLMMKVCFYIVPQSSGHFDPEAHPELKKPLDPEETSYFDPDKNCIKKL